MKAPAPGLRTGQPMRSGGTGALAGALVGAGWGIWAAADGGDTPWWALALYLGTLLSIAGAAVGLVFGLLTLPGPRSDRRG